MPNWVATKITFNGKKKDIKTILNLIGDKDTPIDFEKIIPMPENIYRGNVGQVEREQYGADNWYDWSIENWGTKWNADESYREDNIIVFQTAWSLAGGILEKLAEMCNKVNVTFDGLFCDEDWGSDNLGRFTSNEYFHVFEPKDQEDRLSIIEELWGVEFDENGNPLGW